MVSGSKMALNISRTAMLRTASRAYAASAAANPSPVATPFEREGVKVTTLPNGIVVASQETYSPLSRVGIFLKAGSSYETSSNLGLSHVLRTTTGLGTRNSTSFKITRHLQQLGASLTCNTAKEYMHYSLEAPRIALDDVLQFLTDVTQPAFKSWEVRDNLFRVKLDLATMDPQMKVLENLHKAAYRSGIGNSVYCPEHMVGKHTPEMLHEFVSRYYLSNRAAVSGVGVNHEALVDYARSLPFPTGDADIATSKYAGGEMRVETDSPIAYAAVAAETGGYLKIEEIMPLSVMMMALGYKPNVKYGTGASGLYKAVSGIVDGDFGVSTLGYMYSDTGLIGLTAVAEAADMRKVLTTAVNHLRSANITEDDVARGKAQLKSLILMFIENSSNELEHIGTQALMFGKAFSVSDFIFPAVDNVKTEEVQAAAKKLASSKMSMAAVGNLSSTPYLDEL